MAVDGSDGNLINLEVLQGYYSFMDVNTATETLEDAFPVSPAPANGERPPSSRDEDEDSRGEGGLSGSGENDELAKRCRRPCRRRGAPAFRNLCGARPRELSIEQRWRASTPTGTCLRGLGWR